jgi:4'-phosphopantetheinyl transferase
MSKLEEGVVRVWRIPLGISGSRLTQARACLASEELERASRFRFEVHRTRYIAAHAAVRRILSRFLGLPPEDVAFGTGPRGKPFVGGEGGAWLHFNLAHSGDLALCAAGRGREVGVDVEQIRPQVAAERIPERFFSPREVAALRALPIEQQQDAFFRIWTRKEAYIKATGDGLSVPLDSFDVSPGDPPLLLTPNDSRAWWLASLDAPSGYVAALVVEGPPCEIRLDDA